MTQLINPYTVTYPDMGKMPSIDDTTFAISEVFFSLQGEGTQVGNSMVFVRLPLCNFLCSFCDSAYSVKSIGTTTMSFEELGKYIVEETKCHIVTFTGGESTIWYDKIEAFHNFLIDKYSSSHFIPEFTFETNGSLFKQDMSTSGFYFTVSPKLGVSGMSSRTNYDSLKNYVKFTQSQFKFVVQQFEELEEVYQLLQDIQVPRHMDITFQPEWYQFEALEEVKKTGDYWKPYCMFLKDLTEHLLASEKWKQYRWRVLPQMHKLFWGNIAGV